MLGNITTVSLNFEPSWESTEVPADRKQPHIVLILEKGKKDNPKKYRPASLTSVPGRSMEKIIPGGIEKLLEDNSVIGYNQYDFMRAKSYFLNLIFI